MKDYFYFLYQNKKLLFLIILLVFSSSILLLISLLQKNKASVPPPIVIYQPAPTPTATYIPQQDYKKILDKDIKDLHWLSNNELSYTFYDQTLKKRVLAKINLASNTNETILIKDTTVKMSELYWSLNNNLIIFDYGNPYTTYLYNYNLNQLKPTNLNGYAYSWSPDSNSIFYYDLNSNPASPKIYNLKTNSNTTLSINNLPNFVASYWSPNATKILLYNFSLATGKGELNILNLQTNSIEALKISPLIFPAWSPDGKQFTYVSGGGIHTVADNNPTIIYSSNTNPQYISYAWINNDDLIVFDGEKSTEQFVLVSTKTKSEKAVLPKINADTNQRAQFAVSPDSNTLVVALEKNGLWTVKRSLIYN